MAKILQRGIEHKTDFGQVLLSISWRPLLLFRKPVAGRSDRIPDTRAQPGGMHGSLARGTDARTARLGRARGAESHLTFAVVTLPMDSAAVRKVALLGISDLSYFQLPKHFVDYYALPHLWSARHGRPSLREKFLAESNPRLSQPKTREEAESIWLPPKADSFYNRKIEE
ncbi:hypothetical protein HAX54_043926 [Datura stramonium]|uniref:Uncharacterized protein n=1 Tax=Datura stramonium TaxID=4076 RepID=A0ABS8W387_DATST|nr:hypothetical protein [Datura stramonium]